MGPTTNYTCDHCKYDLMDRRSNESELVAYLKALYKSKPIKNKDEQTYVQDGRLRQKELQANLSILVRSEIEEDVIKAINREKELKKVEQSKLDQELSNCTEEYEKLEVHGDWSQPNNMTSEKYYKDALELIMTKVYDLVKK